jgi:hypothetical protein
MIYLILSLIAIAFVAISLRARDKFYIGDE